ncbi:MAG: protein kinase [Sandaracinaceae bacterium]
MNASLGPFDVHRELARGGMGVVLSATHRKDDVPVAIKVVLEEALHNPRYVDDFRAEVQSAAQLVHPHIVTLLEYGTVSEAEAAAALSADVPMSAGSPYLAMELADSGSLGDAGLDDWPTLRRALLELLSALGHAHSHGVVHRDLKPGNVLLHRGTSAEPAVKLADFGIAHASDHRAEGGAHLEEIVGTVSYMAPEQIECRWRDYGPWTDLYALGIMAHQLVSGSLPFTGEIPAAVLMAHLDREMPTLYPRFHVPPRLGTWIKKLTEKRPEARFQCAADAAHALSELGAPIAGSRTPPPAPAILDEPTRGARPSARKVAPEDPNPGTGAPPWATPQESNPPWASAEGPSTSAPPWADEGPQTGAAPWSSEATHDAGPGGEPALENVTALPLPLAERAPVADDWRPHQEAQSVSLHGAGLGLFFLRAVPMVDRTDERDAIWHALRDAAASRLPRALVLRGPTGTGKSRLAEWTARRADELGAATLLRATHTEDASPLNGLPRMVAAHYGAVGLMGNALEARISTCLRREGVYDELEAGSIVELLALSEAEEEAPSISRVRFASPVERYLAVEGVLSRAAEARPVIVWLDDAQWGGDAVQMALHALDHLEAPVLFLLTVREEALIERDAEATRLAQLVEHERASRVRVGPLAMSDTSELIEKLLGLKGSLADRVCQRVDGNPLFAVQLVGDWVHRGVLQLTPNGFGLRPGERGEIPDDVGSVWIARVDRLLEGRPEQDRAVLQLAAILGARHEDEELGAVTAAWGTPLSPELLDTLARAHLVERDDTGWAFIHGMLRESLVRTASDAGHARRMHAVCAEVIEARGGKGSAERHAEHLAEAGLPEHALAPFLVAAQELRDGSDYARALDMLARREQLMTGLELPADDPRWGDGWVLRADVHRLEWDFDAAETWARNARSSAAPGWERVIAESELILANVARQQGAPDEALAHVRVARERYHKLDDDDGRARALLGMAILSRQRGEYEAGAALYARAFALFEMLGDERGAANAMLGLAHIARHDKQWPTAEDKYEAARDRCERAGYRAGIANCLMGRADVQRYQGDLEAAEEAYRAAHRIQKSIGSKAILVAKLNLGLVLLGRERWEEARRVFEAELPGLVKSGKKAYLGWLRCVLLPCVAASGDAAAFDRHLDEACALTGNRALVDEDMAKAAERAMSMWREREDEPRTEAARRLAHDLFVAVGDDERAAALA